MSSVVRYLGKGLAFPVAPVDATLGVAEGAEKVRQSIRIILDAEPGERIMRPSFGCGLRRYLMTPNTASTRALIQRDVTDALGAWEPRIKLQELIVCPPHKLVVAYRQVVQRRILDREIALSHRALDVDY